MKKYPSLLIFCFIFTFSFSQNLNSYLWNGVSVSTSDNLDAMGLNPAGFGVNRGEQFALTMKQFPIELDNKYILTYSRRTDWGLGLETSYDTFNEEFSGSIAYGTSVSLSTSRLLNNIYTGFKYSKNGDYSFGLLYRPLNGISIGITNYRGDNIIDICDTEDGSTCVGSYYENKYSYNYVRTGIALRPFTFIKSKNKFINYSNLTIGYDKSMNNLGHKLQNTQIANSNDAHYLDKESYQEQFFMSLTITPGIDLSYFNNKNLSGNTNHGLNLSFQIGSHGAATSYYPENTYYGFSTGSNSIYYYNYSQEKESLKLKPKKDTYIHINLEGYFIEEEPTIPFLNITLPFLSNETGTQLKSWIDKIDEISSDEKITGLIINLKTVKAGFAKRRAIHQALNRLKNSGKKIIVYSENDISNANYHLISMADEIYTHRMSSVSLMGFSMEPTFIRGLLDTVSIVPEVIRVSPYKTAADMLLNKEMSPEMEENYSELLSDIYDIAVDDISSAKGWDHEKTIEIIDNGPYLSSIKAIEAELINGVMFPDEFDKYIKGFNDEKVEIINWNNYGFTEDYINDWKPEKKPKVAVIYAVGGIISGKSNPGPAGSSLMGDETIMKAIKKAREDKEIEAIVLRVDSGGGSALASDMMWKEVYNTTNLDTNNVKPFIVSMSDVAASGGYYISCQADAIVADEATITGSIGVIWARINFSELMKRIGINSGLIKKGKNSDFGSSSHLLTNKEKEDLQENIIDIYNIFKERVIEGRDNFNDIDELDEVALGRVWSGKKARELGLVDINGSLHDAIDLAKANASIPSSIDVEIIELPEVKEFSFFDLFSNNKDSKIELLDLKDIFPEELSQELEVLEIIPVIMNDEIQFLMPYKIYIN